MHEPGHSSQLALPAQLQPRRLLSPTTSLCHFPERTYGVRRVEYGLRPSIGLQGSRREAGSALRDIGIPDLWLLLTQLSRHHLPALEMQSRVPTFRGRITPTNTLRSTCCDVEEQPESADSVDSHQKEVGAPTDEAERGRAEV